MAKRKDSVALFEVITAAKRKEAAAAAAARLSTPAAKPTHPAVASVLRTPKWWFKGKNKSATTAGDPTAYSAPALPAPAEHDPTQFAPASFATAQFAAPVPYDPTAAASAPAPGVVQRVAPATYTAAPERVTIPAEHPGTSVDPFGLEGPSSSDPTVPAKARRQWPGFGMKKVGLDPDRREVTVRFRYTTAIVVGFAVCVAVGLAYVSGRHSNRASAGSNGVTSDGVKHGPVLAGVLDITTPDHATRKAGDDWDSKDNGPTPPAPSGGKDRAKPAAPAPPAGQQPKNGDVKLPGEAAGVETRLPRSVGLNYVVVQSYPDRKSADEAKQALEAAGVPSTVEKGLKDWADPSWFSVVGTHGFSAVKSSAAYRQYEDSIRAVSKSFAGTSKYKKFDPSPYKWKSQP